MRKLFNAFLFSVASLALAGPAVAADHGTAAEAKAMVEKGVAFYKANGRDKMLAEVVNHEGQFIDRDLYLSVWDLKARVLAHGANPRLVGKDIIDLKDADGKSFMREIVSKAASTGKGWVDYKWVNPVSQKIQAKSAYFEKVDDVIISSGYYKN